MTEKIVPILAGGGTRLPAHLGVLHALKKLQIQFDNIVGVSGGSIIASLFASGLSIDEIKKIALTTNYTQFTGFSLFKLIRNGGLSSGDVFEKWVDDHLQGKTFAQMDIQLHLVATDVKNGKPVIFNQENTPNMKVSEAVRFSCLYHSFLALNRLENTLWLMAAYCLKMPYIETGLKMIHR
jgi:NTE family protein